MREALEGGQRVTYWLIEFNDRIKRRVDLDGNGTLAGAGEITVFRNSGALDGGSWPQSLDIADDGAVWWSAALSIANPRNGISRLEDLDGGHDAADPGAVAVVQAQLWYRDPFRTSNQTTSLSDAIEFSIAP